MANELRPAVSRWSAMVNNTYAYEIFTVNGELYITSHKSITCPTKPKIPIMNNRASQSIRVGTITGVFVAIILEWIQCWITCETRV